MKAIVSYLYNIICNENRRQQLSLCIVNRTLHPKQRRTLLTCLCQGGTPGNTAAGAADVIEMDISAKTIS